MLWVIIAYVVATPIVVWFELTSERGDGFEERLRRKASGGFKSVAWMFDSGFATWNMLWAILAGPITVTLMAIVLIAGVPILVAIDLVSGGKLLKDDNK